MLQSHEPIGLPTMYSLVDEIRGLSVAILPKADRHQRALSSIHMLEGRTKGRTRVGFRSHERIKEDESLNDRDSLWLGQVVRGY